MAEFPKNANPSYMNRRKFLKLSTGGLVAIVGGHFLNACSPAPTAVPTAAPQPTAMPQPTAVPPTAVPPTAVPPTAAPQATATMAPAATATTAPTSAPTLAIGGRVDFLSWEGYDLPTCMGDWDKAHNVTFSSSYIGDHNEIQAKLTTAKSVGYDLVTYFQGYSDMYANELKILQPIDTSKVPNFANLYERFRTGAAWLKDGKVWGVPFTWGAEGCNYNADMIKPPQAWTDLLKPEFKGKVGMVDVMFDQVTFACIVLGFRDSLPNLTAEQLAACKDFLLQMKKQARSIAPSYGDLTDLLVSGEIVATFPGWAAINVWAAARNVNVQMTIPVEGGYSFCDALAIPAQSDNVDSVLAWINEAISPAVQACQSLNLAAGVVTPNAIPLLDKSVATMYDYAHMDDFFKKAPFYTLPPSKSDQYATYEQWAAMWEEVKAA